MLLRELVDTSRALAATSKRLEKADLLSNLLKRLEGEEREIGVAFLTGGTRQGKTGLGWAALRDAGAPETAESSLTLTDVDRTLEEVARIKGGGAAQRRRDLVRAMMERATGQEQEFLQNLVMGELRQGALEGIMLEAAAKASRVPEEKLRRAAMMAGDLRAAITSALTQGEAGLAEYDLRLFRPVQPMLSQAAEDIEEALEQLGDASLEYKLDGARIQVHRSGNDVRVYTRNLNDVTEAVPEVVDAVMDLPGREFVLDGEVLSLHDDGRPRPFQVTMRRFGRKLNVHGLQRELPIRPFWFDLLYLNGTPTMDEPQEARFRLLKEIAPFHVVPNLRTADPERAAAFVRLSLEQGHEGAMAKAPGAKYAAGARGASWLKVKRARSADLVILAAEWGNGRRKGMLSNLHLGARDPNSPSGWAMLGKTFKGLTDEMLRWQTQELLRLAFNKDRHIIYVEPKIVVEIAFNDVQISPHYKSGYALRFARVKRFRPDKSADQADTLEHVLRLGGVT